LADASALTEAVIGAAIAVHRTLGPGFLETVYDNALCLELTRRGIAHARQREIMVRYQGELVGLHRLDLLIANAVVVELKAIRAIEYQHFAVVRSYLRVAGIQHGLLVNFAGVTVDVKRVYPKDW
jgi:GxxExxY protein